MSLLEVSFTSWPIFEAFELFFLSSYIIPAERMVIFRVCAYTSRETFLYATVMSVSSYTSGYSLPNASS